MQHGIFGPNLPGGIEVKGCMEHPLNNSIFSTRGGLGFPIRLFLFIVNFYPFRLKAPVKWSFDPGEIKVGFTPVKQKKILVSQGKLDKN